MKRFSAQLDWPQGGQDDLGHCALCSVDMKKPRHCRDFEDRVNPSVRCSYWSPGLYGTPRRLYGSRIFEPSKTTRFPPSKINPTRFAVSSERVLEAENPLTLGHLLCTKTREVRAKEFKEGRKREKKIVNEKIAEKEKDEKEEEGEENKKREKEEGEEKEAEEEEKEEEKKKEVEEEEEDKEKQERQEKVNKDKGEKERLWPLQETDSKNHRKKWISGSHVQGATPRTVAAAAEKVSIRQTYRPQEGSQPHQDSPSHLDTNAQVYPRKHSCGFSRSSPHCQGRDDSTLGPAGEDAPRSPHAVSTASCATLRESSLKREVEQTGLPGFELTGRLDFTPLREPQEEKLGRKPQAAVPKSSAIPLPAAPKIRCKRKGAILELCLPPSRPPIPSATLRLLCDQQNLPPPPKIPRTHTQRESDTIKNKKHQAIQLSDDKVDVFQPKTQVVAAATAPQPVLPRPSSASVSPVSGVSSPVHPASTPLLCQAAEPPIPSVSSPSLTPSIPTIPISPSALPSDSLPPCQAGPCVETPPDAKKKDPTDVAIAPAISHLPRPGAEALSFNPSSCGRDSTVSVCTANHPPLPFSADPLSPSPREPPTVFPTSASHDWEDMCWEPSPWPADMGVDTKAPSEAATLSSPTVHTMTATTPSSDANDVEFMDTTPPSKAVIFHSSPGTSCASNSLNTWSMWRSSTVCHHSRVQSTSTRPKELQSNGRVLIKKSSPATAAVGLPSRSVSGSKTRFAGSASPADRGRPSGTRQANEKCPPASYIAKSTLGHALKMERGTRQCSSSSTNITPSTATSVRPVVPVRGDNLSGKATQKYVSRT